MITHWCVQWIIINWCFGTHMNTQMKKHFITWCQQSWNDFKLSLFHKRWLFMNAGAHAHSISMWSSWQSGMHILSNVSIGLFPLLHSAFIVVSGYDKMSSTITDMHCSPLDVFWMRLITLLQCWECNVWMFDKFEVQNWHLSRTGSCKESHHWNIKWQMEPTSWLKARSWCSFMNFTLETNDF